LNEETREEERAAVKVAFLFSGRSLRQLRHIGRDAPRLVVDEQLVVQKQGDVLNQYPSQVRRQAQP